MNKILVTGNLGFIGGALCTELKKNTDYTIETIDSWIFTITENFQNSIRSLLRNYSPDAVFHVGACSDTLNTDVEYMMQRNVNSTMIISDWCKDYNVPLIYSSSASVVGNGGKPESLYAWSKYMGEIYVIANGGIALRYFNVYGSGEEAKGKMASLAFQAFRRHKWGEKVYLFPKKPMRDFIYVKDVVSANIYALSNYESLKGKYYEVGTGEAHTFEDVLSIMGIPFEYADKKDIPENYQYFTEANADNFMEGWNPSYSLKKGLEEYQSILKVTEYLF